MKLVATALVSACVLGGAVAFAPSAHAHASYDIAGYGPGVDGSTNGADGLPATPGGTWTNGDAIAGEYAGSLPVNWYAGMHTPTATRTITTGTGATPAANSLLAQVLEYNAGSDPDLPTDRVLAVGGRSWSDPANDGQGWGHGLDYGLIHYSPVETILAEGPLNFTITLADDGSDPASVQLAFAIYAGWDSGSASVRHQPFITSPSPVDNPLGSTGLTLIDYAFAAAPGQAVARTYQLDDTHDGKYTVFVAALGGVKGQYTLTVSTAPPPVGETDLAQCLADLETMAVELDAATADADGDGHSDQSDACAATPAGEAVDQAGCSQAEFCASMDATTKAGAKACKKADWKNDEPLLKKKDANCTVEKGAKGSADDRCVPAS